MRPWLALAVSIGCTLGCAPDSDCPPTVAPSAPTASAAPSLPESGLEVDAPAPTLLLLVRHAEKADDGTADPPLTERGRERAECLAAQLDGFSPTRLFTTPYQRTRATLEPLAAAVELRPVVIDAKDDAAWRQALTELPAGSRAVVVGHSNTLPALVASLGGRLSSLDAEGNIPHDEYGRLIHVVVGSERVVVYTTSYCEPTP